MTTTIWEPFTVYVRQVRYDIRRTTFNIRNKDTSRKSAYFWTPLHRRYISPSRTRLHIIKPHCNSTSGLSKIGAKRVQHKHSAILWETLRCILRKQFLTLCLYFEVRVHLRTGGAKRHQYWILIPLPVYRKSMTNVRKRSAVQSNEKTLRPVWRKCCHQPFLGCHLSVHLQRGSFHRD